MKKNKISIIFSTPAVIISLLLFFPLGIILLIGRLSVDKKLLLKVNIPIQILGWINIFFGLILFIFSVSEPFDSINYTITLIFFTIGGLLTRLGIKLSKNLKLFNRYKNLITYQNVHLIKDLAQRTQQDPSKVSADIDTMIELGFLPNAYIDEADKTIDLPKDKHSDKTTAPKEDSKKETTYKVVTCKGCGANNTVAVGQTSECEYCGNSIT